MVWKVLLTGIFLHMEHFNIQGHDCCSEHAVAFHYVFGRMHIVLEYFLYNLRPIGVESAPDSLHSKMELWEIDSKFNITEYPVKLVDEEGALIKERLV